MDIEKKLLLYGLLTINLIPSPAREPILRKEPYCTGRKCISEDGDWSTWVVFRVGNCNSKCFRNDYEIRHCTQPPPAGNGSYCIGDAFRPTVNPCRQLTCNVGPPVNGEWSPWAMVIIERCKVTCRHNITLSRLCTNPPPQFGYNCRGPSHNVTERDCFGGKCTREQCYGVSCILTFTDNCTGIDCFKTFKKDKSKFHVTIIATLFVLLLALICIAIPLSKKDIDFRKRFLLPMFKSEPAIDLNTIQPSILSFKSLNHQAHRPAERRRSAVMRSERRASKQRELLQEVKQIQQVYENTFKRFDPPAVSEAESHEPTTFGGSLAMYSVLRRGSSVSHRDTDDEKENK